MRLQVNKNLPYRELCELIAKRSICQIQVGALIYDSHGLVSWGWNHSGHHGFGCHAEHAAITRANRKRLRNSSITVVSIRRGKFICSFPCPTCFRRIQIAQIKFVECNNHNREWMRYKI